MSPYFPKPYEPFGGDVIVKVDLSNYSTKTDLKNLSHVDVSSFALKSNLASWETEVDKLDIDKLTRGPDDLAKLRNVVKNDVVKKTASVIFKGKSTLVQYENHIIAGGPIVNIYVAYKTSPKTINSNCVFKNCLYGAIKIKTTNSDTDKWHYSGYGIGFDSKGEFSHPDGGNGKNVIIFGADVSNSRHANNKTKHVLVLGRGFIQK